MGSLAWVLSGLMCFCFVFVEKSDPERYHSTCDSGIGKNIRRKGESTGWNQEHIARNTAR